MKFLLPLTVAGLLLSTAVAHPQPYDPYGPEDLGPPPHGMAPPPPEPPPQQMVCFIDGPVPFIHRSCATHPGHPGSPCHCPGSFFEGTRDFMY